MRKQDKKFEVDWKQTNEYTAIVYASSKAEAKKLIKLGEYDEEDILSFGEPHPRSFKFSVCDDDDE